MAWLAEPGSLERQPGRKLGSLERWPGRKLGSLERRPGRKLSHSGVWRQGHRGTVAKEIRCRNGEISC